MSTRSLARYLAAAELSYGKRRILLVYGICIGALLIRWFAYLVWPKPADIPDGIAGQVEITIWITIAASALVTHILFRGFNRHKRNRMLVVLPVSPLTIVTSRLVAVTALQVIPLVFWVVGYALLRSGTLVEYYGAMSVATLPPHRYDGSIWTLLTMLAICLYVSLLIALAHGWRKASWGNLLFWLAALIFNSVLVYPAGSSPGVFLPGNDIFNTPWGTLYYCAIAVVMAGLNILVYMRKRSYCD